MIEIVTKWASMVPAQWATVPVIGVLLLAMSVVLGAWLSTPQATPPVTIAVSLSQPEMHRIEREVKPQLERDLGATIELKHINPGVLVPILDRMVATETPIPWDLISVDNDTLEILVKKGLVQELPPYLRDAALPRDSLFQALQEKLRVDGRDYFVPFRAKVKLMYYNQKLLSTAKANQPPATWKEWENLTQTLASKRLGRVAIQAQHGKAAAVTVFEFVTSMGGKPLTLDDDGARQAFKRLWNLAPFLDPASTNIQFDTANSVLITDRVAVVDNWTYGIKEVMGEFGKTYIKVAPGLRDSVHVLGGDVLAIPTGLPEEREKRAIKLIEQLVAKNIQGELAKRLVWAPVREDVYTELSSQQGSQKEYFQVIREVLRTAVMRPLTPDWGPVEAILSDALQEVLRQGAKGEPATDARIDALLRPFITDLQAIPREIVPCSVVERASTSGDHSCQVEVPTNTLFKDIAPDFKTTGAMLAAINGRGDELAIVSPKTMKKLLVPKN